MEFIDAFLLATSFAYLGCLIFTLLGKPPMVNIEEDLQGIFYLLAWIIFMLSSIDIFPKYVYAVLGGVYCIISVGSFIGYPQRWSAYWKENPEVGSATAQVGMACWDLAIAVCFFMKLTWW